MEIGLSGDVSSNLGKYIKNQTQENIFKFYYVNTNIHDPFFFDFVVVDTAALRSESDRNLIYLAYW